MRFPFRSQKSSRRASLEIGHSRLRLAICDAGGRQVRFFDCETDGYRRGKVVDPAAFSKAVGRLFASASTQADQCELTLVVPALHSGLIFKTVDLRLSGSYQPTDWERACNAALDSVSGDLDEPIDAISVAVQIDGKDSIPNTFDVPGQLASIKIAVFTYPKTLLMDLLAALNSVGIRVSAFQSSAFCLFNALRHLRPDHENAVILDVGHNSTSGILVVGGAFLDFFAIPAGASHMLTDLMSGSGLDRVAAFELLRDWGIASHPDAPPELRLFLRPRVMEILRLAGRYFALYSKSLDGGTLLIGGGSQLKGLGAALSGSLGVEQPFSAQMSPSVLRVLFGDQVTCDTSKVSGSLSFVHIWSVKSLLGAHSTAAERFPAKFTRLRPLWTWISELSQ